MYYQKYPTARGVYDRLLGENYGYDVDTCAMPEVQARVVWVVAKMYALNVNELIGDFFSPERGRVIREIIASWV